jgi:hypothetical protein
MDNDKEIVYVLTKKVRQEPKQKEIKKRVVTQQMKWVNTIMVTDIHCSDGQLQFLEEKSENEKRKNIILRELNRKIEGYRYQDKEKNKYDCAKFVDLDHVLLLLRDSKEKCFYCKEAVKILYDVARDPKQWTLERIFNERGHNKDNVEIACLSCNIKRRTMYYEKFRFTKQVKFVKEL